MGYFLFVDESGHDRREAPYMVLAGIIVEDRNIWSLIQAIRRAEEVFFGMRITRGELELKGKKLLKRKTFRHAGQFEDYLPDERASLAKSCLEKGLFSRGKTSNGVTRDELTALAQTKIAYVNHIFDVCKKLHVKAIGSIVDISSEIPQGTNYLRKDYAYLFERFYYFLENMHRSEMGYVVFDELDKTQSHILLDQMEAYFLKTKKGRDRAARIIPEPFFVHSDMSSLVQVADILAYVLSWGQVFPGKRPVRPELEGVAKKVAALRSDARREIAEIKRGQESIVYGFALIDNLCAGGK